MKLPIRFPLSGRVTARSRWSYLLTMPWFAVFFSYLMVGSSYWQNPRTFFGATLTNLLLLTATFYTQNAVTEAITRRYSHFEETTRRVGFILAAHTLLSAVFLVVLAGLYIRFRLFGSALTYQTLLLIYIVNLGAIVLTVGIQETFYALNRWQQHRINKEKLRKENLQGQLQSLKNQVSPHFLFNSLNSLSSLIAEEPQRAEQFVDEMARVYRYLLQTNSPAGSASPENGEGDELTTLAHELTFIESYFHLLKTRHGSALHLEIRVDEVYRPYRLPPLTLQLLVENAVKHNSILTDRPLCIEIATTANGFLVVRNNLQKKNARTRPAAFESTRIGLANIRAKYQLLGRHEPLIEDGPDYFTVTLPLLEKTPIRL